MAYLTQAEYDEFGLKPVPDGKFTSLEFRARLALDHVTFGFYRRHDLETDITMRKSSFKEAMALQIEYMLLSGVTSIEQRSQQARTTSSSVGGTSVSVSAPTNGDVNTLASKDAIAALSGTGLTYAGVAYVK